MKINVKLNKGEKKKLARLKRELKSRHAKMVRTYESLERSWKRGKAPSKIVAAAQDAATRAKKATNEAVAYYGRLRKKFPR